MQIFLLFLASTLLGISTFTPNTDDQILGQWTNEDRSGVLEFVKNGSTYDAIVREAINPAYIGKTQISSLKYHKDNRYKGGTLHAFEKGKTLNCAATLISENELELKLSKGPMSKKKVLTRFNPEN